MLSPMLMLRFRGREDREMEGVESAAVAHRQQDKYFVGGRGSATTPMTVMAMVGILDKSSKVAERILDSRR